MIAGITVAIIGSLAIFALLIFVLLGRKSQRVHNSFKNRKGRADAGCGIGIGHATRPSEASFLGGERDEESRGSSHIGEKHEGIFFELVRSRFAPHGDGSTGASNPQPYGLLSMAGDAKNEWDEKGGTKIMEQKETGETHIEVDGSLEHLPPTAHLIPSSMRISLEANPYDDPTFPISTILPAATAIDDVKAMGTTLELATAHAEDPFWDPQDLLPPVLRMIAEHAHAKTASNAAVPAAAGVPTFDEYTDLSGDLNVDGSKMVNSLAPTKLETSQINDLTDPFADKVFMPSEIHKYESSLAIQREWYTSWITQTDRSLRSSGASFDARLDIFSRLAVNVDSASQNTYTGVSSSVSSCTGILSQLSETMNVDGSDRTRPISCMLRSKSLPRRSTLLSFADSELTLEARTDSDSGHGDGGHDGSKDLDDE
ncbi:hypothetical protein EW145_g5802 [Phellinidium pouzarii]|uniref:Uncharacterized protein n=1 Tax=Phellinidium pouzarii TaxID=167371 RepID=A0A4S4KYW0_9AGAM|nr:hypothetical protein EW145_g5802 [Phellinidium pouzarii]